jgi:hypothetical protein
MGKASGGDRQNFGGVVRGMSFLRNIASGLRSLLRKEQVNQELYEELNGFLEMAAEEKVKQGMTRIGEPALNSLNPLQASTVAASR